MADGETRRLAAIMASDVVGYSALMGTDEVGTVSAMRVLRKELWGPKIDEYGGRIVKTMGDGLLVEFPSVADAVQCAVEIQRAMARRNADIPEDRRIVLRIGINQGDVIVEGDDILGDGVNVAARLEGLSEPGGICISRAVRDQIRDKLLYALEDLGEQELKNIARPVRVFRVSIEETGPAAANTAPPPARSKTPPGATTASAPAAEEDPILALPRGPRIAVLPFDNLSGDPEQEYFSDGMTEEIITELARFRDLFVMARQSTAQYKGQDADVAEIADKLGVDYVVEGSVRRGGDTVRITAQLIDATSGAHLWAETFEEPLSLDRLFAVQDQITAKIVANIGGTWGAIARAKTKGVRSASAESLQAYECTLIAQQYFILFTTDLHLRARTCLEKAVAASPSDAAAWGWLAMMYTQEYVMGFNARPNDYEPLQKALEAGRNAVEADPQIWTGHIALSTVHFYLGDIELALGEIDKALRLNPNDTAVLAPAGFWYGNAGHYERGVALATKTIALNPNAFWWTYVPILHKLYLEGNYQGFLDVARKADWPEIFWTHAYFGAVYGQLGRDTEAKQRSKWLQDNGFDLASAKVEFEKFFVDQNLVDGYLDGLRKAGVPEGPATAN